jgi:hypothetical protein
VLALVCPSELLTDLRCAQCGLAQAGRGAMSGVRSCCFGLSPNSVRGRLRLHEEHEDMVKVFSEAVVAVVV